MEEEEEEEDEEELPEVDSEDEGDFDLERDGLDAVIASGAGSFHLAYL